MFTGIISQTRPILAIDEKGDFSHFTIDLGDELIADIQIGASVAINGCCLTVTAFDETTAHFDVMGETLRLTTLGTLVAGDHVNVERAAKQGDEIGGHQLSGHIDGVADIVDITETDHNYVMRFAVKDDALWRYIFNKGYIAIDGASLTVVDWQEDRGEFAVHLIPETLKRTVLAGKKIGDQVNIEIDRTTQAIVDTVTRVLKDMNIDKAKVA